MIRISVDSDLILRTLELSDADLLFALTDSCRRYLRQWLPWLDATQTVDDTRVFIQSTLRQLEANAGFQSGVWSDGRLVGVIGFHHLDWPNRSTNIGYWLGEHFQGRGIMTRSCAALVEFSFESWNLHRVEIRCAVNNTKSRAIPERLGFVAEGMFREAEWLYDHFVDHIVYGMLENDWRALQRSRVEHVSKGN